MLYVGELERKYLDIAKQELALQLVVVSAVMMLLFLSVSILTRNILRPIEELYHATGRLVSGDPNSRVKSTSKDEIGRLCDAFNHMAEELQDQRTELEKRQRTLEEVNEQLETTNKNYMDMLAFVPHELKNPLASAIMRLFTVKDEYIGSLSSSRDKYRALLLFPASRVSAGSVEQVCKQRPNGWVAPVTKVSIGGKEEVVIWLKESDRGNKRCEWNGSGPVCL